MIVKTTFFKARQTRPGEIGSEMFMFETFWLHGDIDEWIELKFFFFITGVADFFGLQNTTRPTYLIEKSLPL